MKETNQHDIITKKVLSNKTYAIDFLKNTIPKNISSKLDFNKLKLEKGSFIDEKGKEYFTDILYSIPLLSFVARSELNIFCIVEHKSYPDKNIHAQLLMYLAGVYKSQKKHLHPHGGNHKNNVVIPVELYHGK